MPRQEWTDVPAGTRCLLLVLEDPDAPSVLFRHWGVYNMVRGSDHLAEGVNHAAQTDDLIMAMSDFGNMRYDGPAPPLGDKPHRYVFRLAALDRDALAETPLLSVAEAWDAAQGAYYQIDNTDRHLWSLNHAATIAAPVRLRLRQLWPCQPEGIPMSAIPRAAGVDNTIPFLREAYTFVSRRCDRLNSDLFATRIMLTPVVCLRGAEAARFFYDGDRFTRQGAMPQTVLRLLQDKGSVQGLDGAAHRRRKAMFMSLMSPEGIARAADLLERHWRAALPRWASRPEVTLLPEIGGLLTRTACDWAGVPLTEREAPALSRELQAMIRQAGHIGPGTLRALALRRRTERRIRRLVEDVRAGRLTPEENSALAIIAHHKDADGAPLTTAAAAVEIINLLRPIVAVNRFITFAALALHQHPAWRQRLNEDEDWLEPFVQEVRRFYPFFPIIGGRTRAACDWGGHHFAARDWVILDLYGTNHDSRLWEEPEQFRPERFRDWPGDPYTFIPQGAGDFMTGHRCPGEWITIALIKQAVRLLCGSMHYDVPPQDLSISLSEMPTAPRSGLVISQVRATGA